MAARRRASPLSDFGRRNDMLSKVGVVGAGVMGVGVAQVCAQAGHPVTLVDVGAQQLQRARKLIERQVRIDHMMGRSAGADGDPAARIRYETGLQVLEACDLVVENAPERVEVKRPIYEGLDEHCAPGCVLIANTSAIPIAKLASYTSRPAQVIGVHFMNPVPLRPTVEVVRAEKTSDEVVDFTCRFLESIGKRFVLVNDGPGFVSNRVLMLTINEAIRALEDGVADAESIDRIFCECFGHTMGPLATADLIGLDTIESTLDVLESEFGDPRFHPAARLSDTVRRGHLGRKTRRGFFDYRA